MLTKKLIYMHKGAVTLAKYLQNCMFMADVTTLNTM